jgi:hypothetical protein
MINEVAYDYENVRIVANGREIQGVTSLSYGMTVTSEKIGGTGREDIDATEGSVTAEDGEMEMHEYEFRNLIETLGPGFLRKKARFDMTVSKAHTGEPVITDTLQRVRLMGTGHELSKGDVPMVSVPIQIMKVIYGGANGNQIDPMAD